jgi:hypothetical protein
MQFLINVTIISILFLFGKRSAYLDDRVNFIWTDRLLWTIFKPWIMTLLDSSDIYLAMLWAFRSAHCCRCFSFLLSLDFSRASSFTAPGAFSSARSCRSLSFFLSFDSFNLYRAWCLLIGPFLSFFFILLESRLS